MIRKSMPSGHDPTGGTGFPKRSCSNKKMERDDRLKRSHLDRETSCKNATEIPDESKAGDFARNFENRLPVKET
jgi:hypothetical protein